MARRMLIDASHREETRVVVVDGTKLQDFDYEMASRKPLKGNIFLAKVIRIEPSLQAAFVDFGGNRHGFLAFSEIHPDYYQIPMEDRQALIEERMRVVLPEESGLLASIAGPATFVATRVVVGTPTTLLARLREDLEGEENLAERRRFPDRVVWGPRGGFAGAIRQLTRLDGRGFPLSRADEVAATVVAADKERTHVRLEATLFDRRVGAAQASAAGTLAGGAIATVGIVLNVLPPLALASGIMLAGFTAWQARRSYLRDARHAQLAIEQTLDRLEFGEPKRRRLFSGL